LVFLAVGLRIQNIRWFIDLQRRASFHKVEWVSALSNQSLELCHVS
jgi:hypothetical protein